jgi:hypothetical protein
MNQLMNRPSMYTTKINSNLEVIEYDMELAERRNERIWANLHIVAIVGIVALTVISVSNNNRDIELSKQPVKTETTHNDNKPHFNFKAFTGETK